MTRNPFGKKSAINCSNAAFERRKDRVVKSAEERAAEDAWNGVDRRRQALTYRSSEPDHITRKAQTETLVTFAVIMVCVGLVVGIAASVGLNALDTLTTTISTALEK